MRGGSKEISKKKLILVPFQIIAFSILILAWKYLAPPSSFPLRDSRFHRATSCTGSQIGSLRDRIGSARILEVEHPRRTRRSGGSQVGSLPRVSRALKLQYAGIRKEVVTEESKGSWRGRNRG